MRRRRLQWFQYCTFVTGCLSLIYASSHKNFTTTTSPTPQSPATPRLKAGIDQIRRAAEFEQQSRFREAINLLESLQSSGPAETFALNQYKQRLAKQIFDRANDKHQQGQVETAIKIASAIPTDTPAYKRYQAVQVAWGQDLGILKLAKTYKDSGKNQLAIDVLSQLSSTVQSSSVAQAIQHQAQVGIQIAKAHTLSPAPEIAQSVEPKYHEEIAEHPAVDESALPDSGNTETYTASAIYATAPDQYPYTPPENQSEYRPAQREWADPEPLKPKYSQPVKSVSTPVPLESQPRHVALIRVAALPKHYEKSTAKTKPSAQCNESPLCDFKSFQ